MNDDFPRDISILLCFTEANNPSLASCLGGDAGYIPRNVVNPIVNRPCFTRKRAIYHPWFVYNSLIFTRQPLFKPQCWCLI